MEEKATPKPMQVLLRLVAAAVVQRAVLRIKGEEFALFLLNSMFHTPEVHWPEHAEPFHAATRKEQTDF